ncbi:rhodanese-like domain-containing protein [Phycicoccus sp. MAQZ13P-2]|nr:rhodanese-like domain-containing protein [Phycicoccus mangrovi]MBT9273794.1 rhodanese-like domain-containing protein [Phycicoccus mangrovi]
MDTPDRPRVLDVRTAGEFTTAHVPGSYNVPLDLLTEHRDELAAHLAEDVVLVCRSGARAGQAEQVLAEAAADLPNLHVLTGGVVAWEAAGAPLVRGEERWELERQVRLVAGSIVLLSVLASLVVPGAVWVAGAVGAGLAGAALTNTCAMGMALSRLPYNRRNAPSLEQVLADLRSPASRGR